MNPELVLYSYWRSSAAYRVRIALNLKGLAYTTRAVHLVADGGQQHAAEYKAMNPQELVPTLVDGRRVIHQSLAIIEYLDEQYPGTLPLLPRAVRERARVRALSLAVACEIHPVANLRVMQYLERVLHVDQAARLAWTQHWIGTGLDAVEATLADHPDTGSFCQGDSPTLADACLVPQVYNARRWGLPVDRWPAISRIEAACLALPAFQAAGPENQPDAPDPAV